MKRLALAAVAAVTLAIALAAPAVSENKPSKPTTHALPARCKTGPILAYIARVWDQERWRRGDPSAEAIAGFHARLACARPSARPQLRHAWRELRSDYYALRRSRLWRARVTPYYGCTSIGGCGYWAIPAYIVDCESGGRYHDPSAPNGAYSLLAGSLQGVPTWESWRPGWASEYALPYQAPAKAQDVAAHRLWAAYGSEPWECA